MNVRLWPRLELDFFSFFFLGPLSSMAERMSERAAVVFRKLLVFLFLKVTQETAHWTLLVVADFAECYPVRVLTPQGPPLILQVFWLHLPRNHRRRLLPTKYLEDMSEVLETASWPATHFLMTLQSFVLIEKIILSSVCD